MRVQAVGRGIVFGRVLLGQKQNLLLVVHHLFERAHGFLAADEQRNDHVGKHHDVAQRQNRRDWSVARIFVVSLSSWRHPPSVSPAGQPAGSDAGTVPSNGHGAE